jgi:hypothetical protein
MKTRFEFLLCAVLPSACCTTPDYRFLTTIADARSERAQTVDLGAPGDSNGDLVVFDQPLLDRHGAAIGRNSGVCIRTRVAESYQCQWTLGLPGGTIQVAGREADRGASPIAVIGGTGAYTGISGEMTSTNNDDGTFTQVIRYRLP